MKNTEGFSLIELMVTLALVAILAALAAPSFSAMLANAQIRTGAQSINDGLVLARVEAIRRNARVIFTLGTQSTWGVTNESDTASVQSSPVADGSSNILVTTTPVGATKATFDGRGHLVTNTDATSSINQVDVTVPTSLLNTALAKNLRINVSSGGAIRLCNPNGTYGIGMGC